jgi:uncharacterized protein (TIGR02145 family)
MKHLNHQPFAIIYISFITILTSCCTDAPVGTFSLPIDESCYFRGDEILIEASATDDDGNVVSVEFQLNGNTIVTLNASPYEYSYEVTNLQDGVCTLTGVATDDCGNTGSWEVTITILPEPEVFTDSRDGKVYRYVRIGDQDWMIDNLAWLPSVSPSNEISDSNPVYYVSDYQGTYTAEAKQTDNYSTYGVLYNWTAANSCCPEGWHLPSNLERMELETYISTVKGEYNTSAYDWGYVRWGLGTHLLHTTGWADKNKNGLNTFGFSVLPGGIVNYAPLPQDCPHVTANCRCYADFWSVTINNEMGNAWGFWAQYPGNMGIHNSYPKGYGLSVRCVKDD